MSLSNIFKLPLKLDLYLVHILLGFVGYLCLFWKSLTWPFLCWLLTQCMRSENSVLSYLASIAVRGTINFAAEHGIVEIGNATKVKCLSPSLFFQKITLLHFLRCLKMRVLFCFLFFVCLPISFGLLYFLSFCSKNLQIGWQS